MFYRKYLKNLTLADARILTSMLNDTQYEDLVIKEDSILFYKLKCLNNNGTETTASFIFNEKRCYVNWFPPEIAKPVENIFNCSLKGKLELMHFAYSGRISVSLAHTLTNLTMTHCFVSSIVKHYPDVANLFANSDISERTKITYVGSKLIDVVLRLCLK